MSTQSGGIDITQSKTVQDREDEGTWVHVRDASGEKQYYKVGEEEKPVRIKVAGSYSKRYRRIADAQRERLLKTRRTSLTADGLADNQRELAAGCSMEWEGFNANGQPFDCVPSNAALLY